VISASRVGREKPWAALPWPSIALVAPALAALPFAEVRNATYASLGYAATAVSFAIFAIAAAMLVPARRPSLVLLCCLLWLGTAIALGLALTLPVGPGLPPPYEPGRNASSWFYIAWHVLAPLGGLGYVAMRGARGASVRAGSARVAVLGSVLAGLVLLAAFMTLAPHFPPFLHGSDNLSVYRTSGVAPVLIMLAMVAYLATLRVTERSPIDRGVGICMLACGLDVVMLVAAGQRYSVCWYVARALAVIEPDAIFIAIVIEMFQRRDRSLRLRDLRERDDARVGRDAARLDLLRRLASVPEQNDTEFLSALTTEAARALRLTGTFHGCLMHVDEGRLIVDLRDAATAVYPTLPDTGAVVPLENTIAAHVIRRGRTIGWSDVHASRELVEVVRTRDLPFRAYIATPFRSGATTYVLAFFSMHPLQTPFTLDDETYLETVASLCAARLMQRSQSEQMQFQTRHDALTGVLNRASFAGLVMQTLRESAEPALIVADIDRFRLVNDSLGQRAGDIVLAEVATALAGNARPNEVLGRLAGDTFGILIPDCAQRGLLEARLSAFSAAFAAPLAAVESDSLERVPVTVSFGAAVAPADGVTFEHLLAHADTALAGAKSEGRGRWARFDRDAETARRSTQQLQDELARAIAGNEFELYFQPHVEFDSGRVSGAEALIRWNHPTRGLVMPLEFIPFAEQHGLAPAIGNWVMRETVRCGARWARRKPGFRTWFNLSANELSDAMLLERLRRLDPSDLQGVGVEITESVAMRNPQQTAETLTALRDAGLRVALDDFGTGYSSLAHLKRLPVDIVKIDRSFVSGVPRDKHDVAIVEAVISIAARYGFQTVAEGVETLEQVAFLSAAGCTFGQGFAYAAAMPAAAFDAWLTARTEQTA
jgi:diguanylate cyclase (GGDEF)-like protein